MMHRALIVEPNQTLAKRIQNTLCCENLDIEVTSNDIDVIEVAHSYHPDVIVLDSEVLQESNPGAKYYGLLKSDPTMKHIPVVILTEQEQERSVNEPVRVAIGDYYLPKNGFVPFTLVEIFRWMEII